MIELRWLVKTVDGKSEIVLQYRKHYERTVYEERGSISLEHKETTWSTKWIDVPTVKDST